MKLLSKETEDYYDEIVDYTHQSAKPTPIPQERATTPITPQDKYYKFSSGKIVKCSAANGLFYSLDKYGSWKADGSAMAKFYDAASDYDEISGAEAVRILGGKIV